MINVIYLVSELVPSGPIHQALNIVTGFDKSEINVMVVTLFEEREQSWIDRFLERGIRVVQLHLSRKKIFLAHKKLLPIIKEEKIDVVHSSGFSADIVNCMLRHHVLTVSTFRSHISDICERNNFIVRCLSRIIFRYSLKHIKIIVGCSNALAADMEKELGRKCAIVQNGADIDYYRPVSVTEKENLRNKLRIPIDKSVFVSVGLLEPRKNMVSLIRAFNDLPNQYFLVIVGDGVEKEMLNKTIKNKEQVFLVGQVNNSLEYYQSADFFISASLAEGLPNTVLEAMSCGLPCLLSDIGPHREMLNYDKDAGCIFDHSDINFIYNSILDTNSWDMNKASKAARGLIVNNLSMYCMSSNYTDLYKRGLNEER